MTIEPPWHVGVHDASSQDNVPTSVTLEHNPLATLADFEYPPGVIAQLAKDDRPVSVYQGSATIRLPVTISPQAKPGQLELALLVRFQPCDERSCQRPTQVRVPFAITIA